MQTARDVARAALRRWRDDPVRFAREALGIETWDRQAEVMRAVAAADRVAVRSGHKVGKSKSAGALAYWWLHTRPGARVILTSTTDRQVRKILWREVKAIHRDAPLPLGGDLAEDPSTGLRLEDGREIVGFTAKNREAIAGISGPNTLFVVDEASGVPEEIFEAIDGNRAGGVAKILLLSNPTRTSGYFYDVFHSKRRFWNTIHIASTDTPNVREGRSVIPGLANREWCEEKRQEYGEASPFYDVRVLGNFPSQAENAVIALVVVQGALDRWEDTEGDGRLHLGVDVARFGDDESAIAPRRGDKVFPIFTVKGQRTTEIAGRVLHMARELRRAGEKPLVKVDVIGVGAGVADQLRESKDVEVVDVNVAEAPTVTEKDGPGYALLRDQLWFGVQAFLQEGGALPSDPVLEGELVAPTYTFDMKGRRKVESKDSIKKRLGRSPDRADAVALAIYEPPRKKEFIWVGR